MKVTFKVEDMTGTMWETRRPFRVMRYENKVSHYISSFKNKEEANNKKLLLEAKHKRGLIK